MRKNLLLLTLIAFNLHAAQERKAAAEGAAAKSLAKHARGAYGDELLSPITAKTEYPAIHELVWTFRNCVFAQGVRHNINARLQDFIDLDHYEKLKLSRDVWSRANRLALKMKSKGAGFVPREQSKEDIEALDTVMLEATKPSQAIALRELTVARAAAMGGDSSKSRLGAAASSRKHE